MCDLAFGGYYQSQLPVRSIIFMGAPHRGLDTTAIGELVKSKPTEVLISELRAESPTLMDLSKHFPNVAKDVDILSCFESMPTKTIIEVSE
jgi:hypothetical protein